MKLSVWIFFMLAICTACGGKLTDDQRKRLREGMKRNQIRKISEVQVTEAAFELGRLATARLGKVANKARMDSTGNALNLKISTRTASGPFASPIEKQIIEAYVAGSGQVQLEDNVQRLGVDSLLYTKPVLKELPDGSSRFTYAWTIVMSRKQVVSTIKE